MWGEGGGGVHTALSARIRIQFLARKIFSKWRSQFILSSKKKSAVPLGGRQGVLLPFFLREVLFELFISEKDLFLVFLLKWPVGGAFGGIQTSEVAALCLNPLC
jgi:hypothetical protein